MADREVAEKKRLLTRKVAERSFAMITKPGKNNISKKKSGHYSSQGNYLNLLIYV